MENQGERRTLWSQVILAAVVWLVSVGVLYGTMRAQIDEMQRQQRQDEQDFVRRDRFDESQNDIKQRLERIEHKIDQEKSEQRLNDEYNSRRR